MRARRALALAAALVLAACAEFDYGERSVTASGPPQPASTSTSYRVRRGDTLYSIAWRNGLDYRRLARWNDIPHPYTIYPGQRLALRPQPGASASRRGTPATASSPQPRPAASTPAPGADRPEPGQDGGSASASPSWQWPVEGPVLRGFEADGTGKRGISIGGREGQPVRAAAQGRVVYSGDGLRGYGNLVIVKHSERYLTAYGYNQELLVREGERVSGGQRIARMGLGPGRRALLHFELRRDGEPVDPRRFLPRR